MGVSFIVALGAELTTDPEVLGYSAPPALWHDEAAAIADYVLLTAENQVVDRESVGIEELLEAIDEGEEAALIDAADLRGIARVFQVAAGTGQVDIRSGTKARAYLEAAFAGGGSPLTIAALGALISTTKSRAAVLGFSGLNLGHIQLARRDAP